MDPNHRKLFVCSLAKNGRKDSSPDRLLLGNYPTTASHIESIVQPMADVVILWKTHVPFLTAAFVSYQKNWRREKRLHERYLFDNCLMDSVFFCGYILIVALQISLGKMFCLNNSYRIDFHCPVDLSVSDKVHVDDQSRTTGDYYLYIPFRMFRFLDSEKVRFSCNVIVCQHDCPWADCGDYMGMSYGRRKRSAPALSDFDASRSMTVTNEVSVLDDDHRMPRASGTGIVEEEVPPPKAPSSQNAEEPPSPSGILPTRFEYLIGGAALVVSLLISVCVNVYLLIFIKRKLERHNDMESSCTPSVHEPPFSSDSMYRSNLYDRYNPRFDWKFESREILYPPMPIRHARTANRSHSFKY
ncbi:ZP domain-containing protein [Caerostris darwini]|uniref:ZP domain-containing protein n=1 Tax=Caerostris darwini TaxID=1538125 RepID=A0AAV4NK08_9ARAC|nr:ZP domain-containing protein [Caerostris darwini]